MGESHGNNAATVVANCTAQALEQPHETHTSFIAALLLLIMIAISLNLAHYMKHKNFTYLSETAVYILCGLVVSAIWTSSSFDPTNAAIQLDSHFFALVLLPPIIFQGGYSLQRSMFFTNILPILGLAILGGFFSTFVVAIFMYAFSRIVSETGWSFIESLVFGSLISSTDPVTVLSLLPVDVDKRLYMLIFGESALNDAVSIILFRFFVGLQEHADNVSVLPFIMSFLASLGVFIGSFLVGIVCALIFAKLTKHVWISGYEGAIYEMAMLIVFAYASYLLAELLSLTGIIAIFFAGIGMSHYATPNLTDLTKKTIKVTLNVISHLFEGFIFLYFGLGLLSFGVSYDILLVFFAIVAILVARCHVFVVCGLTKYLPGSSAIPMNQQILMWFSGLRGAVAFALAVTFLEQPNFSEHIKQSIFGTTVLVILFTVLGLGGLTPYMLRTLKIVNPDSDNHGHHHELPTHIDRDVQVEPDADQTISEADLNQPVFGWLYRLDVMYIRPYFSHPTEEEIKKKQIVERIDSRLSRHNSVIGRLSFFSGGAARNAPIENLQMSPTSYTKLKEENTDQQSLISKTKSIEEHPADSLEERVDIKDKDNLESVNLN